MAMRVTTNSSLRTYRSHLARATSNMYQSMNTVLTNGRRFNSFSDAPALATQSYRVHSAYARNQAQQETSSSAISKFEAAFSSLQEFDNEYNNALSQAMQAGNPPSGGGLKALGQTLTSTAEAMVQTLNAKYGDKFIFAGADGDNAPFSLKDGQLYFRDIPVDTEDEDMLAQLKSMAGETTYVDVGLGFELDENEQVIPSTAFNSSISGIGLTGYGVDEEGVPNNVISIISQLGAIYSQADTDGNLSPALKEEADQLFGKMQESYSEYITNHSEMESRAEFLKSNDKRLATTGDTLVEQYESLDRVDLADALTTFAYAQYSYNAALRVGNEILSQSFLDYMS
ncbi:hypothetical protein [Intestinibacillus sp. Marseille-P6563]|uniref:hypothetical protein n=1 Tax=Intestinibacillus sp. Marseille-P6563 TaxID=2364792 RepID=UPI000F059727|nr:hypothetical protein [Intestinibacillus sp. Marseille-P6563]